MAAEGTDRSFGMCLQLFPIVPNSTSPNNDLYTKLVSKKASSGNMAELRS
jgi:hypothetical protein